MSSWTLPFQGSLVSPCQDYFERIPLELAWGDTAEILAYTHQGKQSPSSNDFPMEFPQHAERIFSRTFRWVLSVGWRKIVTYLTRSRVC